MEHELGETFTWNGHTLEVVEVKDPEDPCSGCYFFEHGISWYGEGLEWMGEARRKHTKVIIKEATKTEEL